MTRGDINYRMYNNNNEVKNWEEKKWSLIHFNFFLINQFSGKVCMSKMWLLRSLISTFWLDISNISPFVFILYLCLRCLIIFCLLQVIPSHAFVERKQSLSNEIFLQISKYSRSTLNSISTFFVFNCWNQTMLGLSNLHTQKSTIMNAKVDFLKLTWILKKVSKNAHVIKLNTQFFQIVKL